MNERHISITAAASVVGVHKSTLCRQVKAGLIRSKGGKVKLSQVLEDRAANLDFAAWNGRRAAAAHRAAAGVGQLVFDVHAVALNDGDANGLCEAVQRLLSLHAATIAHEIGCDETALRLALSRAFAPGSAIQEGDR